MRHDADMPLHQLAERSGVSRAMLSKVERGEKSPTISIISRIAQGLGVGLSELLKSDTDQPKVTIIRPEKRQTFRDPKSGFERHLLSPSHIDNTIEFILHRIPPGARSGLLPAYSAPAEKYIVVHEGQLTIKIDGNEFVMEAGDSIHFELRNPYEFFNNGTVLCSYYMVVRRKR